MTKEQGEALSKWEQHFNWAIQSNFVHLSQAEFNEIALAYKEVCGVGMTKSQMTCNTCRLKAVKALGEEYFKWKEEEAKKAEEKPVEESVIKKIIKKVGRPRKINLEEE